MLSVFTVLSYLNLISAAWDALPSSYTGKVSPRPSLRPTRINSYIALLYLPADSENAVSSYLIIFNKRDLEL